MIIFVRTRYEYPSYWDFWELVRLSQFETCYVDEIDWQSENIYILTPINGELPNPLPDRTCKVIWLNIERPSSDDQVKFNRPDFDEIWVCDENWALNTGVRYFLMGSHHDLRTGHYINKEWDYVSHTYDNPRRTAIWSQLDELRRAPNGWVEERSHHLANSRLYVVPQQDDPPHAVTPLRFAIAAAHKLPMVYESASDTYPFVDGKDFIHARSYKEIVPKVHKALTNPNIAVLGDNLYRKLCIETDFRTEVERMF